MNILSVILITVSTIPQKCVWVSEELEKLILKYDEQQLDQAPLKRMRYKVRGFYKMYYKVQISKTV